MKLNPSKFSKFKNFYFVIIAFLTIFIYGCKKLDSPVELEPQINNTERFFTVPAGTNGSVRLVVEEMNRRNNKKEFINLFAKKNGFPVWDKAIFKTYKKKNGTYLANIGSDEDSVAYIPFVQQDSSNVNGYILARLGDTINLSYSLAQDYKAYPFKPTPSLMSASQFAFDMVLLNKNVFGNNEYIITDQKLFSSDTIHNKTKRIVLKQPADSNLASLNSNECWLINWLGIYCGTPNFSGCKDEDGCDLCGSYCYYAENSITICSESNGGGFGGAGNPPPPPGGDPTGGGGGGGGTGIPHNYPCPITPPSINEPVCPPPGGGSGWVPVPIEDEPTTTITALSFRMGLTTDEINWLNNHSEFAYDLLAFLNEAKGTVNIATNIPFYPSENPEAIMAAKSTLQAASLGIIETGFNQTHFVNLIQTLNSPYNQVTYDPMWAYYFSIECINIKAEHPEWSNARVYLEASLEVVHIILDVAGLVPVIGEIADLANGGIYVLQGDGVNATLSLAAAIPVAGWTATAAKYAKKLIIALDGSKRTLKWFKEANGLIKFGDRGLLRKVLGLAKGDSRVAHHLIPWEHFNKGIIQKAAAGDFHMNEILNGIPLTAIQHNNGGHALYNDKVFDKLQSLLSNSTAFNWNNAQCANAVRNLTNNIRNWIAAHPNESINNIIIP